MGDNIYYSYITKLKMLGIQFSDNIIADTEDTKVIEVNIKSKANSVAKHARYFIMHKSTGEIEEIAENCQNIIREQASASKNTELSNVIIAYNNKGDETHVFGYLKMNEVIYDRLYNAIDTVIIESSYSNYSYDYTENKLPDIYSVTKIKDACDINCEQCLNLIIKYITHMPLIENIEHPELMQYASKKDKIINHSKSNIEIGLADCFETGGGINDFVYSIINKDNNEIKLLHKMCGRADTDITDLKCHTNYTKSKLAVAISDIINNDDIIIGIIDNENTSYSQFFKLSLFDMQIVKNELEDNIQILTITGDTIEWIKNTDNPDNKHYIVKVQYNLWADYNTSKVYMNGYILDRELTDRELVEWE